MIKISTFTLYETGRSILYFMSGILWSYPIFQAIYPLDTIIAEPAFCVRSFHNVMEIYANKGKDILCWNFLHFTKQVLKNEVLHLP